MSSIAALSSNAFRARRSVSRCTTSASFTRSRPNSAITAESPSLDRIRSTDGMLRSAESAEAVPDLGMGAYCRGLSALGCRLSGRYKLHLPDNRQSKPIERKVIKQDDELDKLEEDIRKLKS